MSQNPKADLSLGRRTVFLLLLGCVLAVAANGQKPDAAANKQTRASESAVVTKAVATSFGPALEAVTSFKPFYLKGDFNGDRMPDLLVVVQIKLRRTELPKDVRVLNPFYKDPAAGPVYPVDPTKQPPTFAFVIIHGTRAGWDTSQPTGKFLLVGESSIPMLHSDNAMNGPGNSIGRMDLIRKGSRPNYGMRFPATAKGDAIGLPTGGGYSILYWNGKTYRWLEAEE